MLTAERLRALLHYDPLTGLWTWLVSKKGPGAQTGKEAGHRRDDGYRILGVDGKQYYGHRLAWLYMTGEWPPIDVDHENTTKGDDRWLNLRAASKPQNLSNAPIRKHNTSGFKGISQDKRDGVWQAQITFNKRRINLGRFATPELAHAAYCTAASEHHGKFARTS